MVSCHDTTLSLVQVILQAAATNRQQLPAHLLARLEAEKGGAGAEAGELKCEVATSALSMFRTRQICGRTLNMCYQVTSGRPPPASS